MQLKIILFIICIYLCLELALKILFADDKGIICFAKSIISLDPINTKIITVDILFLFQQLIESFPMYIVNYIKSIMVNTNIPNTIITNLIHILCTYLSVLYFFVF